MHQNTSNSPTGSAHVAIASPGQRTLWIDPHRSYVSLG